MIMDFNSGRAFVWPESVKVLQTMKKMVMQKLVAEVDRYHQLLGEVDNWFANCLKVGGASLSCRGGCSACCRALFDITLLDAWILKKGFADLPKEIKTQVLKRCQSRLSELNKRWPDLRPPYRLNTLPEEEWLMTPEDDPTPCPLLDENGLCLVYANRPLICRLHGLPNIDVGGEDFEGTVCSLHEGNPFSLPEHALQWRFREVFTQEVNLLRNFTAALTGQAPLDFDTFIPLALLADYDDFDWHNLTL